MPLKSPDPQAAVLLTGALLNWATMTALVLELTVLAAYLAGVRKMVASARPWPLTRTASFVVGLAVVAYAVEGGVARYQRDNFTVHVVQVLLLADVAPPLLAFGAPVRLAVQSWRRGSPAIVAALRSPALKYLSKPWVAFALCTGTLYCYFLTPVYAASERSAALMAYAELQILVMGWLLAWVVVGRDALPRSPGFGARFGLVLLSVPFNGFLGVVIAARSRPLLPAANTLADTRSGGNVLWALAEVFVVAMAAFVFVEWAREEERRAVRADRQLDAALAAARTVVEAHEARAGRTSSN
jgi:putative membrane protein